MVKKIALLFLLFPAVTIAQTYHRVVYAPFQVATDTTENYDGNNTTQPDSVWSVMLTTGKIAGIPVHRAYLLESSSLTFASNTVVKHYENNSPAPFSFLVPATMGHGTDFLRGDLTWQGASIATESADSISSTTGDTLKYVAGQTNWWLENDSGTTAHFYLMKPDSATMEGTVLNITTIFTVKDTITVVGGVDKNLTTILMYNGLGASGAPGTSVVLTCHKGKLYSRNSGFVIQ